MKYILAIEVFLFATLQVNAQEEISKNLLGKNKGYSLFWGGVETSTTSYVNTDTKDSNGVQIYIAPYIEYYHKSGLGISVKSYAFPGGSNPGLYLTSVSPYFARYSGKVIPYVSYTRYIQHGNPSIPYSPIQNEIYGQVRVKTRYIDPWAGIDIGFGKDGQNNNENVSDVNAFVALTHLFVKDNLGPKKENELAVMPGLLLNAGTDRYYKFLRTSGYIYQNTKANRTNYRRGMGNPGSGIPGDIYTISEVNEFSLSNLELNLYIMYFFGKFSIEPSGSLYFPLRGNDGTPYGYWQVNINYWFK
ncbi:MAG TPA: hypothetical protein VJ765_17705 [Chitinophagaceae bacterium]|nr:hypothetical protein [Chitinophagaceae bacterium]